jgi:hypothetical protein
MVFWMFLYSKIEIEYIYIQKKQINGGWKNDNFNLSISALLSTLSASVCSEISYVIHFMDHNPEKRKFFRGRKEISSRFFFLPLFLCLEFSFQWSICEVGESQPAVTRYLGEYVRIIYTPLRTNFEDLLYVESSSRLRVKAVDFKYERWLVVELNSLRRHQIMDSFPDTRL